MRLFWTGVYTLTNSETVLKVREKTYRHRKPLKAILGILSATVLISLLVSALSPETLDPSESADDLSSVVDDPRAPKITHSAYEILSKRHVTERNADVILYRHRKTQTEFLAMLPINAADGEEDKAFGISFRTLPKRNDGVANVLMNAILCGSKKYPLKDTFRFLRKGSVHSYLNAKTMSDRTVYALASRHPIEFRNLIDVYLDAVFAPLAIEDGYNWIFRQEGWRVVVDSDEHEVFDGVVLSEMLGVYSQPESLINRQGRQTLFPDTVYKVDYGGEPSQMPTLTRQEMIKFYNDFYHPTNAQMYVSGTKDDVVSALDKADAYLSEYKPRTDLRKQSVVKLQPQKFTKEQQRFHPFPTADTKAGKMMAMSWLLNSKPFDPTTELAVKVLSRLLFGTSSSVLHKALTESKLGTAVLGDGLDLDKQQATFTVGLKGITSRDYVADGRAVILFALDGAHDNGFTEDEIESALNTVEFQLREFDTGSVPRSVAMFYETLKKWNYVDQDPMTALTFENALTNLKSTLSKGGDSGSSYLTSLMKDLFIDNQHRSILKLEPSTKVAQERVAGWAYRLSEMKKKMSADEYKSLLDESKELAQKQIEPNPAEALEKFPLLSLTDLNRKAPDFPVTVTENAYHRGVTILSHEVKSSAGIVYVDFGMDASVLDYADVQLLPFFIRMMTETGTELMTDDELNGLIGKYTGGIWMTHLIDTVWQTASDEVVETKHRNMVSKLFIRGKCTEKNVDRLLDLFIQILKQSKLDSQEKAVSILNEMISESRSDVQGEGHLFAASRIKSRYTVAGFIHEQLHGLTSIKSMVVTLEKAQSNWSVLLARLENMRKKLLQGNNGGMVLNLTGEKASLRAIQDDVKVFLETQLPEVGNADVLPDFWYAVDEHPWLEAAQDDMKKNAPLFDEGFVVPTQVSYIGKGGILFKGGETVSGSTMVVCRYLQMGYLWETVRIQHGAYSAIVSLDVGNGVLTLASYRDPNLVETLEVFDGSADYLLRDARNELPQHHSIELNAAIVGMIGELDGMSLPPSKAGWDSLTRWLRGETSTLRQRWRDDVFKTKLADFTDFGHRLAKWGSPSVTIIGSQAAFDAAGDDHYEESIEILPWGALWGDWGE